MIKKHRKMLALLLIFSTSISGCIKETDEVECPFFGTWYIEKVAVISEMYTGTTLDGVLEENLYDSVDYIGYELEYSTQYFRIGNKTYEAPEYVVSFKTVDDFDRGGKFVPHLNMFLKEEGIKMNNTEDYTLKTMLLQFEVNFKEPVEYEKYSFIPVGTQCVLLNNNTMIVEIWGGKLFWYVGFKWIL